MAYAASERKKLPFTLLWTFLKTSLNMGSGPPGIKSITFSVSLTVGSPSHLPAHRTGCDFGHWIHVKPHTTDCLRTWVSLSHQANYILLVLQSGDLPGAVIRRKKNHSRNETRKTWRCSKQHFAPPVPCKRGRRHWEHLPQCPILPLSSELQLRCTMLTQSQTCLSLHHLKIALFGTLALHTMCH